MSVLNKIALKANIDANITTNSARDITALKVNESFTNIIDSLKSQISGTISSQIGDYQLVLTDAGTTIELSSASACNIVIPNDSDVLFEIGAEVDIVQINTGQITVLSASGVTLKSRGGRFKSVGIYSVITLKKRATNDWYVYGDVTT